MIGVGQGGQISTILLINLIINFFIILLTSLIPFGDWFMKQNYEVCRFDGSAPSRYLLKMPIYLTNVKKWIGKTVQSYRNSHDKYQFQKVTDWFLQKNYGVVNIQISCCKAQAVFHTKMIWNTPRRGTGSTSHILSGCRVWLLFRKYRQLFIIHSPEWDYYFWHN